jgi:quercetin dioxygenase-like cupin family protein
MGDMVERGAVLRNAFNGETFIFCHPLDDPKVAAFDIVLEQGGSGGADALVHIHPLADETFIVKSGRLKVVIAGKAQVLEPGQSAIVPRGVAHYFVNANAGPTEATVKLEPAQQHLRFFANFGRVTAKWPNWFSKKGAPHFLLIALTFNAYRDHLYVAGPPVFLQKLIFALLAPIARLRGYRMEIEPLRN